jgi:hypothetical protein
MVTALIALPSHTFSLFYYGIITQAIKKLLKMCFLFISRSTCRHRTVTKEELQECTEMKEHGACLNNWVNQPGGKSGYIRCEKPVDECQICYPPDPPSPKR